MKRLKLPIKKTLVHPKACQEARGAFQKKLERARAEGKPLVFCDESGFAHDMPRTHGYARRGKRCWGQHNWGEKGRTHAIGALLGKTLLTVSLIVGTVNTVVFNA